MNYSDLTARIQETTENTFETAQLAMFARQAEQFIYNSINFSPLKKNQTGNATTSNPYLSLPTDYLATNSLAVIGAGTYTYLDQKDVNFMREAYPNPTASGLPKYYAQFDVDTFILGPTPDADYTVELHYDAYPASIATAGTSWLGDNFEIALFNACLVEASKFMKSDPDIVAMYEKARDSSLLLLKSLGEGKQRRDNYRDVQNRAKVL